MQPERAGERTIALMKSSGNGCNSNVSASQMIEMFAEGVMTR
jgi:hypothetical protein